MSPKEIHLMPCAGLANRMRAIASAATAAQEFGATLTIGWKYDTGICVGDFKDLFDSAALPPWIRVIEMGYVPDPLWNLGPECNSETAWITFQEDQSAAPIWKFKSWAAFYGQGAPAWIAALRLLRPHTSLIPQITRILSVYRPLVGVHIRRTDHRKAIQLSPSGAFWTAMRKEQTQTKFYVASDSDAERIEAAMLFPGQILTGPARILGRDTLAGCRDALVDFMCLAGCSKILGSPASSFCEIAAYYGGVPFTAVAAPL